MNSRMNWIDVTALVLVIVGALNWGLVGLFDYNLVSELFGVDTAVTNAIYVIVAVAGLWTIWTLVKAGDQSTHTERRVTRNV